MDRIRPTKSLQRTGACGRAPHRNVRTRRGYKYAGLAILIQISVAGWAVPPQPGDEAVTWVMRIATPLGAVLTAIHLVRTAASKHPRLKQELRKIAPASDPNCPVDQTPLFQLPVWHCPKCGIRRVAELGA